jgi:ABC-type multidrug transport system fused ATPase/permease subunit
VDAKETYETQLSLAQNRLRTLDAKSSTIAHGRTLTFLVFLAVTGLVIFERLPKIALLASAIFFLGYIALAVFHAQVIAQEEKTKVRIVLFERGLARLNGTWRTFPQTVMAPDGHRYASDLDIMGPGSLFQRLDETGTRAGERVLAQWLLDPAPDVASIEARQVAVAELSTKFEFRQALITETRMAQREKADPKKFIEWAESESGLSSIAWAFPVAHVLPPLSVVFSLMALFDVISPLFALGSLGLQVLLVGITRGPLNQLWNSLRLGDSGVLRFEDTFRAIDSEQMTSPLLGLLKSGLDAGEAVAARLKHFTRLLGFAELKNSGQMHPIINALLLWDLLVLFRLDAWRQAQGKTVRRWFEALAQFEVLSCFATYRFERPETVFPKVNLSDFEWQAVELTHPLLDRPVSNSVTLVGPGSALIITGSNMSGKTTFMRSLGINTVMALAGLPVSARDMSISWQHVMTSMRLKDSLERGVSYFYAEVQRMKLLLDLVQQYPKRSLFLLDEVFMGTNTAERQIASQRLVQLLLEHGASGCVTTHDLSLCELSVTNSKVRNVHFRDQIIDGQMSFDYTLREGVVTTTNALSVLRLSGIPV